MASVGIALVNFKTCEITRICLELLRQPASEMGFEVWVVDNNSQDESSDYLRSLDWIKLVERTPPPDERGFMAHGRALDVVLEQAHCDFLFLLHTDTFVFDPSIFQLMLDEFRQENVIGVGCLEQINRGALRSSWRVFTRFLSYHLRVMRRTLGFSAKEPKPYREKYIKSFCSLWNLRAIRENGWSFSMDGLIPSYAIQDKGVAAGYAIRTIPASKIFRYLEHVEAGTVAAIGGYSRQHRRTKRYLSLLERYQRQ